MSTSAHLQPGTDRLPPALRSKTESDGSVATFVTETVKSVGAESSRTLHQQHQTAARDNSQALKRSALITASTAEGHYTVGPDCSF